MIRLLLLICLSAAIGGVTIAAAGTADDHAEVHTLPPISAVGVQFDTLFLGGYASGTFTDAVRTLNGDFTAEERALVGQHLDRIFIAALAKDGLGRTGRLRVALERTLRPDGTTRALRVLGAEVAVAGRLHTAYYFERDGRPSYFDALGRALDPDAWEGPLPNVRVNSAFGARRLHPILNRVLPHTGVDLAAAAGDPVRATADGIVVSSGSRGGYGLLVELQHPNGYSTRYAHLSRIAGDIRPSGVVRQGEVIGYVGMTGLATGPHLHYEVLRRGNPVDPMRVAGDAALSARLSAEPRWPQERRRIGELLAQVPTIVQASASN
jgi:murein DD-endopeptidase MepM/ murein hydrolase activator NlpD